MYNYIEPQSQAKLKNFKYEGGSNSYSYHYLWSPIAETVLKVTPRSWAPNCITLSALLILCITHILFVKEEPPTQDWKLLLMAVSIFAYQTLDNLDGKQARKTGTASVVGMMMDHGADSLSSFLISIQTLQCMQIQSPQLRTWALFVITMVVYFCAMWSQYSTGVFRLGVVNPVDDGLPIYAGLAVACVYLPRGFWTQSVLWAPLNHMLLIGMVTLEQVVLFHMARYNFASTIRKLKDVLNCLYLPVVYAATLSSISMIHPVIFEEAYYPLAYLMMFTWSRNMIHIQLCSVTQQRFDPFNIGTLTFLLVCFISLFISKQWLCAYYWSVAAVSSVVFGQFVWSVFRQAAQILQLKLFSVPINVDKDR